MCYEKLYDMLTIFKNDFTLTCLQFYIKMPEYFGQHYAIILNKWQNFIIDKKNAKRKYDLTSKDVDILLTVNHFILS